MHIFHSVVKTCDFLQSIVRNTEICAGSTVACAYDSEFSYLKVIFCCQIRFRSGKLEPTHSGVRYSTQVRNSHHRSVSVLRRDWLFTFPSLSDETTNLPLIISVLRSLWLHKVACGVCQDFSSY